MREPALEKTGPFLVWPVSQRDFYMSVAFALLPTLVWGMIIFGWRVLAMMLAGVIGAGLVHQLLKRWTQRGKGLVFAHSLMSVLVMVALTVPTWPVWLVGVFGATLPVMWWLMRGRGRERVHVAVLWVIVMQLIVWLAGWGSGEGILARDRLLMGDVRNQRSGVLPQWYRSWEIGGDDAEAMQRPAAVAVETLDRLSDALAQGHMVIISGKLMGAVKATGGREESVIEAPLARELPGMDLLLAGAVPGRAGTVSLIGIVIGGLYLAYRTILRPKSVAIFFGSFLLALPLLMWRPAMVGHLGFAGVWHLWAAIPGELLVLLANVVLNSDLFFAAVFVLALPGTEPLTPRGRRVFLVVAGVVAAWLARWSVNLPAGTIVLCALMPVAGVFDRMFAKRSWLNRMVKRGSSKSES